MFAGVEVPETVTLTGINLETIAVIHYLGATKKDLNLKSLKTF